MKERKLFIAGASGAVGRNVVRIARERGVPFIAHYRRPQPTPSPEDVVFPLSDAEALRSALVGCTTVVQLIGTIRKRFAQGDTYESSDIETTRQLAEAGRAAGLDHMILLSSVGAGSSWNAYLKAKAEAEALAKKSFPATHTILRPSAFQGERHKVPAFAKTVTRLLSLRRYEPITVEELAQAIVHVGQNRVPLEATLEGETLWGVVAASVA